MSKGSRRRGQRQRGLPRTPAVRAPRTDLHTAAPAIGVTPIPTLPGGRVTTDDPALSTWSNGTIVPPSQAEGTWRIADLDVRALDKINPMRLLELLADMSPEVSRALWDFQRMCNPGWEITVKQPGSENEDEQAKAALQSFLATLGDYYGTTDVVFGRFFLGAFMRGAYWAELVLDLDGRTPVDLIVLDPLWARFKKKVDPNGVRGSYFQLGQWQGGRFIELTAETIKYVPVDPFPGNPYGRSIAAPSLFTMLFLIGLMHDLRRVISQQGYPRIDLSIDLEKLKLAMPPDKVGDPVKLMQWAQSAVNDIITAYKNLKPEDAYVHTDVITVNKPVGAVDAQSLGAVDSIFQWLERQSIRSLKTMPLMMGVTDGVSEANANRQWEIYVAGIKSLQHSLEQMLGKLFSLGLQAQGYAVLAEIQFAELRAAEMLRDAQTEQFRIANEREKYEAGWTSQDEASMAITGHPATEAEPKAGKGTTPPPLAAIGAGDTGADRSAYEHALSLPQLRDLPFVRAVAEVVLDEIGGKVRTNGHTHDAVPA